MFSPTYVRRNSVADDPVEMLKKKLDSASFAFNRDWANMFRHFDKDNNGSLDAEEFRLALRRVARVPTSLLTDLDIQHLYDAIDDSQNGRIEAREFVAFMNTGAREPWSPRRGRSRSPAAASSPRPRSRTPLSTSNRANRRSSPHRWRSGSSPAADRSDSWVERENSPAHHRNGSQNDGALIRELRSEVARLQQM